MTRQPRDSSTADSIFAGLGSMLGAGVFLGIAPAAGLAGRWMLVGLAIAALAAICTACSISDAARAYPGIGCGYRYTHELLGRWPGRLAGGVVLLGRVAGAAAVAGCFGEYLLPNRPTVAALLVLLVVVLAEALGLRLPAIAIRVLVCVVLAALAVLVLACFAVPAPIQVSGPLPPGLPGADNPVELLPAAGLLFFAFLGTRRRTGTGARPNRSKLAVPVTVLVAVGTYLAVSTAALRELGPTRLALSPEPLRDVLAAANASALNPILTAGLFAATIGVLFALVGGLRDTVSSMAQAGDLPAMLGNAGEARPTILGTVAVGVACLVGVLVLAPVEAIQLAGTCLLFAAAFSNAAARLLDRRGRVWPARTACFGLALCVLLVVTMPAVALATAVLAMAVFAGLGLLVSLARGALAPTPVEPDGADHLDNASEQHDVNI